MTPNAIPPFAAGGSPEPPGFPSETCFDSSGRIAPRGDVAMVGASPVEPRVVVTLRDVVTEVGRFLGVVNVDKLGGVDVGVGVVLSAEAVVVVEERGADVWEMAVNVGMDLVDEVDAGSGLGGGLGAVMMGGGGVVVSSSSSGSVSGPSSRSSSGSGIAAGSSSLAHSDASRYTSPRISLRPARVCLRRSMLL